MILLRNVIQIVRKYSTELNVHSMAEHISIKRVDAISLAIEYLRSGSVIAVPTDTVYGLTCDATNTSAVKKLFSIKSRNEHKPVAICLSQVCDVKQWAYINHLPNGLLGSLLPGPVTIILNCVNKLDSSLSYMGKIGIRIPEYNFIKELASGLGKPLALTSANLSNEPSAISTLEFATIWHKIPVIFNGGTIGIERSASTIIDLSELGTYHIIRKGVAYADTVLKLQKFSLKNKHE